VRENENKEAFLERNTQRECSTWNIGLAVRPDETDKAWPRKFRSIPPVYAHLVLFGEQGTLNDRPARRIVADDAGVWRA
jgi:hypothetical protein